MDKKKAGSKKWEIEQRLQFIEFRLYWEGGINRSDLKQHFRISSPQASADLGRYQDLAPENMTYDTREKIYKRSKSFKPELINPSAEKILLQLFGISREIIPKQSSFLGAIPKVEVVPTPRRLVDSSVFEKIYHALNNKLKIQALYKSMRKSDPTLRWICPCILATDGFRWHIRGFCLNDHIYKDFVISRFVDIKNDSEIGFNLPVDLAWEERVILYIKPHPGLHEAAKRTIELDYGMEGGRAEIKVRRALLMYTLKNLGLENPDHASRDPSEQHIVLQNPELVYSLLKKK